MYRNALHQLVYIQKGFNFEPFKCIFKKDLFSEDILCSQSENGIRNLNFNRMWFAIVQSIKTFNSWLFSGYSAICLTLVDNFWIFLCHA